MKTVKLISVGSAFEANIIKGLLENDGIACILHNENSNQFLKGYVMVDVDIFVYEDDYEAARKIVDEHNPREKSSPISKTEIIVSICVLIIIALLIFLTLEK